jgi:hypothetical protein
VVAAVDGRLLYIVGKRAIPWADSVFFLTELACCARQSCAGSYQLNSCQIALTRN